LNHRETIGPAPGTPRKDAPPNTPEPKPNPVAAQPPAFEVVQGPAAQGELFNLRLPGYPAQSVAFSPDGRQALVAQADALLLSDLETKQPVKRVVVSRPEPKQALFLPEGRRCVPVSDGLPVLWDLESGTLVREFKQPPGTVLSMALSANGQRLLTAGGRAVA